MARSCGLVAPRIVSAWGHICWLTVDFWFSMTTASLRSLSSSSEFKLLAQAQVLPVTKLGAMALAAGRLLVRDMTRMVCLDIAEAEEMSFCHERVF